MEPASWQADNDVLHKVIYLLQPLSANNLEEQREKQAQLNEFSQDHLFCCYLGKFCVFSKVALIFGNGEDQDIQVRQTAGLALKSQIDMHFASINMQIIEYCKEMIMKAYMSSNKIIRETAGNVISLVIFRGGLNIWPGILEFFIQQFDNNDEEAIESAVRAIWFVVEDSGRLFEEPKYAEEMDKMLPSLSKLLMEGPKNPKIRATVINTINMLIILSTETVYNSTEDYLVVLIQIAHDDSIEVRKRAVQGITTILDFRMELILKHIEEVGTTMVDSLNCQDQLIGLAAAEFWSGFAINQMEDEEDDGQRRNVLQKASKSICPILLSCCRFQEADQISSMPSNSNDMNIYKEDYYEYDQDEELDDDEYGQLEGMSKFYILKYFRYITSCCCFCTRKHCKIMSRNNIW